MSGKGDAAERGSNISPNSWVKELGEKLQVKMCKQEQLQYLCQNSYLDLTVWCRLLIFNDQLYFSLIPITFPKRQVAMVNNSSSYLPLRQLRQRGREYMVGRNFYNLSWLSRPLAEGVRISQEEDHKLGHRKGGVIRRRRGWEGRRIRYLLLNRPTPHYWAATGRWTGTGSRECCTTDFCTICTAAAICTASAAAAACAPRIGKHQLGRGCADKFEEDKFLRIKEEIKKKYFDWNPKILYSSVRRALASSTSWDEVARTTPVQAPIVPSLSKYMIR